MIRYLLPFLLVCSGALAEDRIVCKPSYQPHEMILVTAEIDRDESTNVSLSWDLPSGIETYRNDNVVAIWAKPGKYTIRATYFLTRTVKIGDQSFDVVVPPGFGTIKADFTVGQQTPEPTPPSPNPNPQPDIKVDTKDAWVLVVEETAERTAATAKVLQDNGYWQSLKGRGLLHGFLDDDPPTPETTANLARSKGLPALVIVSSKGDVLHAGVLPKSVAEIDAIVKASTGR